MNILSLFDGMSCGRIALERLGIPVENYYASEIDKYAIEIAKKNYPSTKHIGSVVDVKAIELPQIDLLIGGSPCQDFSNVKIVDGVKKQILGLEGEKSKLFFEYYRLWKELNPKYFLLENVGSMKKEYIKLINDLMGVEGVKICSSKFVPQIRNRIYWTNIPIDANVWFGDNVSCNKTVFDLLEPNVDEKYFLSEKMKACVMSVNEKWQHTPKTDLKIAVPLTATMNKMHRAGIDNYYTFEKHPIGKSDLRKLTPIECERLQGVPDNYTEGVSDTQRYRMIGNGWTVTAIEYLFKNLLQF